jgi:hypothetical protein
MCTTGMSARGSSLYFRTQIRELNEADAHMLCLYLSTIEEVITKNTYREEKPSMHPALTAFTSYNL